MALRIRIPKVRTPNRPAYIQREAEMERHHVPVDTIPARVEMVSGLGNVPAAIFNLHHAIYCRCPQQIGFYSII